jgi:hypothetical protein
VLNKLIKIKINLIVLMQKYIFHDGQTLCSTIRMILRKNDSCHQVANSANHALGFVGIAFLCGDTNIRESMVRLLEAE